MGVVERKCCVDNMHVNEGKVPQHFHKESAG